MKHGIENKYLRSMGSIENLNTVSCVEKDIVYFSRTDHFELWSYQPGEI